MGQQWHQEMHTYGDKLRMSTVEVPPGFYPVGAAEQDGRAVVIACNDERGQAQLDFSHDLPLVHAALPVSPYVKQRSGRQSRVHLNTIQTHGRVTAPRIPHRAWGSLTLRPVLLTLHEGSDLDVAILMDCLPTQR